MRKIKLDDVERVFFRWTTEKWWDGDWRYLRGAVGRKSDATG